MNALAQMFEDLRAGYADFATAGGFPDLCTLIPASLVDQGDGHTMAEGTPVTNIPCSHKQLGGGVQVDDNGTVVVKSHSIQLPHTSDTVLIDRHYKIKVAARGFNSELIFEQPVRPADGHSPFVVVLATLAEGYRRPGVM